MRSRHVEPVVWRDGSAAVLKRGAAGDPELRREAAVLRTWDGRGAVRLLEADEDAGVLVLERAEPGASLWELTDERATVVAADVMRRLWRAADPAVELPTVVEWGRGFARHRAAHGGGSGPLPAALFAAAERRFAQLCATAGEPVLLHGDLHQGNVLSAAREPGWLAIDPKGVVGEPAYEPGAFLRNPIDGPAPFADPAATVRRRLDLLAGALRLDRVRLRDWAFAQAMLSAVWSLEDHGGGWEGAVAWAELLAAA